MTVTIFYAVVMAVFFGAAVIIDYFLNMFLW